MPPSDVPACDGCALCCRFLDVPPFTYENGDAPPPHLKAELDALVDRPDFVPTFVPCPWLDAQTLRCRHYEHRPKACRDFQRDGAICLDMRRIAQTQNR